MCIAIITTAHPDYALIVADNRDEFISRPTSAPHWWTLCSDDDDDDDASSPQILSSRDLWRPERGTWLGLARDGRIAVLTNYREASSVGVRSRGGIVSGWLSGDGGGATSVEDRVRELVAAGDLAEYGGFTMVCGKLRRKGGGERGGIERLAVVSNRSVAGAPLPWVAEGRGETSVLSNTAFDDPQRWPKVARGKELTRTAIADAMARGVGEDELVERLFGVLADDGLTPVLQSQCKDAEKLGLQEAMPLLMKTVFVPPLGRPAAPRKDEDGGEEHWEEGKDYMTGVYGTQRQTVILVGWDGEVVYVERSLWDEKNSTRLDRGNDVVVRFKVEGWGRVEA